jgi:hypothetical protein
MASYERNQISNEVSEQPIESISALSSLSQWKRQTFTSQGSSSKDSILPFVRQDQRPLVPTRSVSGDKLVSIQELEGKANDDFDVDADVDARNIPPFHRRCITESNLELFLDIIVQTRNL